MSTPETRKLSTKLRFPVVAQALARYERQYPDLADETNLDTMLDRLASWTALAVPVGLYRQQCSSYPYACACIGACMVWLEVPDIVQTREKGVISHTVD